MMRFYYRWFVCGTNKNRRRSKVREIILYLRYPHLRSIVRPSIYRIPGLKQTLTLQNGQVRICHQMTPQGLVIAEDYVLISAYDRQPTNKIPKCNSVIYVLDKKTGNYQKTIVLQACPHVGGLAYDPQTKRVWVATKRNGQGALSAISLQTIHAYDFLTSYRPVSYDKTVVCPVLPNVSFITLQGDHLYVGLYDLSKGPVYRYQLDTDRWPDGRMEWVLNETKMQGLAIYRGYYLISKSSGPMSSQLLVYKNHKRIRTIDLPPYMEQIAVDKQQLYIVFESGSSSFFKHRWIPHVDWIIKIDIKEIIQEKEGGTI